MSADPRGVAVPTTASLVALRHSARQLVLFPRRRALAPRAGTYRSRSRGRGMEFDEVRPYQPGDDVRTIDWRVTARTNSPHTKVFREERERPVLIAVDLRSSMFFGSTRLKSVVASEVAATLAWAGLQANDRTGGMVFSPAGQRDTRGRRSHHNVLQFIGHLSDACADLLTPAPDRFTLAEILEDIRRVIAPGTSLVIVSDFLDLDRACEKHLHTLTRHCEPTLIAVSDPLEAELPPPGHYPVSDGRRQLLLDTRKSSLREQFRRLHLSRRHHLETLASQAGAGLISVSTGQPFLAELVNHYGKYRRTR